jgi:hypothetical protein
VNDLAPQRKVAAKKGDLRTRGPNEIEAFELWPVINKRAFPDELVQGLYARTAAKSLVNDNVSAPYRPG